MSLQKGDFVRLDFSNITGFSKTAEFQLVNPSGRIVVKHNLTGVGRSFTATVDGVHTLIINGQADDSGASASFNARATVATNNIAPVVLAFNVAAN